MTPALSLELSPAHNLLPAEIVAHRARRRRLRFWLVAFSLYALALAAACALTNFATRPVGPSTGDALNALSAQHAQTADALAKVETQFRALNARLESRRALTEQPDPSVLLALVARCLDDDTQLRHLQFRTTGVDPARARTLSADSPALTVPPGTEREPRHILLTLTGVSGGEAGVTRLTTRLRELNLFDTVDLKRTGRDTASAGRDAKGREMIAFEIALTLSDRPPTAPSTPAPAGGAR